MEDVSRDILYLRTKTLELKVRISAVRKWGCCTEYKNIYLFFFLYTWVRASWIEFNNCPTRCGAYRTVGTYRTIRMNQFQLNNESGW